MPIGRGGHLSAVASAPAADRAHYGGLPCSLEARKIAGPPFRRTVTSLLYSYLRGIASWRISKLIPGFDLTGRV